MRMRAGWIPRAAFLLLTALLGTTIGLGVVHAQAEHVRWDIVHLDFTTVPFTVSEGGEAYAYARNAPTPATFLKIKLTGSGTFVSPGSGGTSGAVTGGGTWQTFNSAGVPTGSGTYWVTRLASGSVRMRLRSSRASALSSTRIGNRPCNSGRRSDGFAM